MTVCCQTVPLEDIGRARLRERVAILIPAYNEGEHLEQLITRCFAIGPALVVVVDDASTDRSALVLRKLVARHGARKMHVLRNERNLGKQGAVRRGLRHVDSLKLALDGVALIDGDGQHDPAELPALCGLLATHDVVIGARSQEQMPLHRRLSNGLVNIGYALIGGVDFVDVQSGLRIYRAQQASRLASDLPLRGGYSVEHESLAILARHAQARGEALRVAAAAISCAYGAASSITARDLLELTAQTIRQALRVRRYQRPLQVAAEVA